MIRCHNQCSFFEYMNVTYHFIITVIKNGAANVADMLPKALPYEKLFTIVECYQFKVIAKPYMFCSSFIQVMRTYVSSIPIFSLYYFYRFSLIIGCHIQLCINNFMLRYLSCDKIVNDFHSQALYIFRNPWEQENGTTLHNNLH